MKKCMSSWISGLSVEFDTKTRSKVYMSIFFDFFYTKSRHAGPSLNMAGESAILGGSS